MGQKRPIFFEWKLKAHSLFTLSILDQAYQSFWPVCVNDASNMHFLRSHSSQLAGVAASGLAAYPHYRPLDGLMSSRYRRAIAIGAHLTGEGLHLTSMTQLSRCFHLAAPPPTLLWFRANGSHFSWSHYSMVFQWHGVVHCSALHLARL